MNLDRHQSWVGEELEGVHLPHGRYKGNIVAITQHLADGIGKSFSAACGTALRKAAWRLFSHEELCLLSAHQQKTLQRCVGHPVILIAEDTTDLTYFQKKKQGLGPLGGPKRMNLQGLNVHTALALTAEGEALGIVHQKVWAPKSGADKKLRPKLPIEQKESFKWIEALRTVNSCWNQFVSPAQDNGQQQTVVLIADREADFFEHYAHPRSPGVELLVRARELKRRVLCEGTSLLIKEVLPRLKALGSGQIKIWRRGGGATAQKERIAKVDYYCGQLILPPTCNQDGDAQPMNLIYIKEDGVASGKDAIEWVLLTSLQVCGLENAVRIARYYSTRWTAERFHLILKSGLGVEKLQIDGFTRLRNALQLYSLIGWHLLWLYRLGRCVPDGLAADYFERQTIEVLAAVGGRPVERVSDFVLELGRLGGFVSTKKQPLPGEKTLWMGIRQLAAIIQGFLAAKHFYGTG